MDIDFEALTAEAENWPEPARHVLPDGFESMPPGLFKAAIAGSVDRAKLNGHDAVRLMRAESELASHYDAGKLATMTEVAHSPGGGPNAPIERDASVVEYASDEISAALSLTRRAAERDLDLALSLAGRLRRVWKSFSRGLLDLHRAKVFEQQLGHLSDETVSAVLDRALDNSTDLTTGQLRARLARLVMEIDPEGVDAGYEEGLSERRLVTCPNPDQTATVSIQSIAPNDAAAINARIRRFATSLKRDSDPRGLDQISADVAVDLLLGRVSESSPGGGVHLEIDVATLAEVSNAPGDLAGYGPVIADIARKTAEAQTKAEWTYTVTDEDGGVVDTGITRRRPTASQKRDVHARYQTCSFPGCRMPAYDCDLDHRKPYADGGPTHDDNLGPLCRHHHMAKHHAPWLQERLPDGDHQWMSPLGHTYVTSGRSP